MIRENFSGFYFAMALVDCPCFDDGRRLLKIYILILSDGIINWSTALYSVFVRDWNAEEALIFEFGVKKRILFKKKTNCFGRFISLSVFNFQICLAAVIAVISVPLWTASLLRWLHSGLITSFRKWKIRSISFLWKSMRFTVKVIIPYRRWVVMTCNYKIFAGTRTIFQKSSFFSWKEQVLKLFGKMTRKS